MVVLRVGGMGRGVLASRLGLAGEIVERVAERNDVDCSG